MSKKLVVIEAGTPLAEALRVFSEKRIRHLPVVQVEGEDRTVIGMLSLSDFSALPTQYLENPVENLMSTPVEFIHESLPIRRAAFRILEKKISSLLVVDDRKEVVGIVTTDDLLLQLAHLLKDEEAEEEAENHPMFSQVDISTIGQLSHHVSQTGI